MHSVVPLILRRMRAPLLVLISSYAVAVLGFVLIPGQDADGQPWRMGFFHAFYFVSYMATTIGFGEIPYPFTGAQRFWATATIYLTVISWFYALGSIISLIQEPAFQQALARNRFRRGVRLLGERFYLICGYGDTGERLVRALTERGRRAVVIEIRQQRVNELSVTELPSVVPALCGDANLTDNLIAAGLQHPHCAAVLAVTNSDATNLQIAITSKLLNPELRVICRADTRDADANMKSFGTDHVINPFEAFADSLMTALHSPDMHHLSEWLSAPPGSPLLEPPTPPRGRWVICGHGRAGRAVRRYLGFEGIRSTLVDLLEPTEEERDNYVQGKGTEAVTLRAAGIETASAVLAATDNDADNLSIILTARELNPELFLVARQNNAWADALFAAAKLDRVMTPSHLIAAKILSLLGAPLLPAFLRLARHQRPEWAADLARRLKAICPRRVPDVWTLHITAAGAPAVIDALRGGRRITVGMLGRDPRLGRHRDLPAIILLLQRGGEMLLLPEPDTALHPGDHLLTAGLEGTESRQNWILRNHNALSYVESGEQRPDGWLWRQWYRKRKNPAEPG